MIYSWKPAKVVVADFLDWSMKQDMCLLCWVLWNMEKQISDTVPNGATALLNDIIDRALEMNASDIHLEPAANNLKVRYRIDGVMRQGITVSRDMIPYVNARAKIMVNADIGESRLPQDGKTSFVKSGRHIDLRLSTLPTVSGEKIVIRILERQENQKSFEQLGIEPDDAGKLQKIISKPQGLIIATGPTGSGKTTTLYTVLTKINAAEKNIMTIEDPVEYDLPNTSQTQVNAKTGLTFSRGLRAILRQDPDVIMVGEIRDEETARVAVQAAMTGHLVLTTLHTNSAAASVARLCDMGIEPYLVSDALTCVISQRLVRRACKPCKECAFSGFKGRAGVFEFMFVNKETKILISENAGQSAIEASAVVKNIYDAGSELVAKGITTKEEMMRVVCE